MKYLCLVYSEEAKLNAMAASEFEVFADGARRRRRGAQGRAASRSSPRRCSRVRNATTVRVRHNGLSTTDGPFAETKEKLGGFYLIEASDLNEAIQVAARWPSARLGSIEVRPLWDLRPASKPRASRD